MCPLHGFACIPITAWHASAPHPLPRIENIWKHSQSKHNLAQVPNCRENKSGSPGSQSKVHWGTPGTCLWCFFALGWECYEVKRSTCLLTPCCAFLASPGILSSMQWISLMVYFPSVLGKDCVLISNSTFKYFNTWSLPASWNWSPVSQDQICQCILCVLREHSAHGKALHLLGKAALSWPIFRHLLWPVEIVQYLPEENSGHALQTLTASWGTGLPLLTLLWRDGHRFPNWCCSRQRGQCQLAETHRAQHNPPYFWGEFSRLWPVPCWPGLTSTVLQIPVL